MNTRRLPQWTAQMNAEGLHLEFKHLRMVRRYDGFKQFVEELGGFGRVLPRGGRTIAYLCAGNPSKNGKVLASAHFNFNKNRNYDKRIGRLAAGGRVLKEYYANAR